MRDLSKKPKSIEAEVKGGGALVVRVKGGGRLGRISVMAGKIVSKL